MTLILHSEGLDWQGQGTVTIEDTWQHSLFASCCIALPAQPTKVGIISFYGLPKPVPKTQHEAIFI